MVTNMLSIYSNGTPCDSQSRGLPERAGSERLTGQEHELHKGKTANGSFFSCAKGACHEVRDKVPSEIMPSPPPPPIDPKSREPWNV